MKTFESPWKKRTKENWTPTRVEEYAEDVKNGGHQMGADIMVEMNGRLRRGEKSSAIIADLRSRGFNVKEG